MKILILLRMMNNGYMRYTGNWKLFLKNKMSWKENFHCFTNGILKLKNSLNVILMCHKFLVQCLLKSCCCFSVSAICTALSRNDCRFGSNSGKYYFAIIGILHFGINRLKQFLLPWKNCIIRKNLQICRAKSRNLKKLLPMQILKINTKLSIYCHGNY